MQENKSSSALEGMMINPSEEQTPIRIYSSDMEKMIKEFQNPNPENVVQYIYQELEKMNLNHTIKALEEETRIKKKEKEMEIISSSIFTTELNNVLDGISEYVKNTPIPFQAIDKLFSSVKSLSQLLEDFMKSNDELFLRCFVSCFTLFLSHEDLIEEISTNLEKCFYLGMKISYWVGSYEELLFDTNIKDQFEKLFYCLEKTGKLDVESCETIRMMLNGLITVGGMSKILFYASDTFDMIGNDWEFFDLPNVEIARQITLQDQNMLLALKPHELYLIDTCWEATMIINRYSNLTQWTCNMVKDSNHLRTKELEKLISIAEVCFFYLCLLKYFIILEFEIV